MSRVEFVAQSISDASTQAATARLVNFYREPSGAGGYVLRATPGLTEFADLGRVWVRAMTVLNEEMIVVCGGHVFAVSADGLARDLGNIGDSEETAIATNTGYATIVAAGKYWTLKDDILTNVSVGFDVASVVTIGSYTVVSELGGRRVAWSGLADPTTFNGLDFRSAETNDDDVLRLAVVAETLVVLKVSGFERWGVTGKSGPDAITSITGGMVETGLREFGLLTLFPNGMAFASTDGRMYVWNGAALQPVSTPTVEYAIDKKGPRRVFYYAQRGHSFICLQMTYGASWCYDIATGEWHERDQDDGPWAVSTAILHNGVWYAGTDTGQIAVLSDTCADFGRPLVRRAVSKMLEPDRRVILSLVEAFTRKGLDWQDGTSGVLVGTSGTLATGIHPLGWNDTGPAQITLRTSPDGVIFGPEKVRSLGEAGHYADRIAWRQLGQFRRCAIELSLSSLSDIPLRAEIEVQLA